MKKFLSLVCVLALALALCVPAFAEDATAGQSGEPAVFPEDPSSDVTGASNYVSQNPQDYEAAKDLNAVLTSQDYVDSNAFHAMWGALYVAPNAKSERIESTGGSAYIRHASGSTVNAVVNTAANNTLKLEFSFADGGQSELGSFVQVTLPKGSALSPDITYKWVNDAGQTGYVAGPYVDSNSGDITLQFYAPHFSVYAIIPVDESYAGASTGASSSASGSSVLAKTNADMNMTAVVLTVLGIVMTAGCAACLKKRALNK